jgi:hypothetical protein
MAMGGYLRHQQSVRVRMSAGCGRSRNVGCLLDGDLSFTTQHDSSQSRTCMVQIADGDDAL